MSRFPLGPTDSQNEATISLIQSKRWSKLLPILIRFSGCIAELARRFADALQRSLEERHLGSRSEFQLREGRPPQTENDWEELAKSPFKLFGVELELPAQQRLAFTRLLHSEGQWLTAGDIAEAALPEKKPASTTKLPEAPEEKSDPMLQAVSSIISKLENKLGQQLNLTFEKGKKNKRVRPIQRRDASFGEGVEYRLNPDLHNLRTKLH